MIGTLPSELAYLTKLKTMEFYENEFTGKYVCRYL